jgi:hypothetical protein
MTLDAAFDAVVIPVIDSVLRRRRRALRCSDDDLDDIRASVIAGILNRLREQPEREIAVLRDYVAVATYHAIDDYFRHAAPQRHMLKNRLRYLLQRDKRLATWDVGRFTVAGLAEWRGINCYVDTLAWETLPPEVANRAKPAAAVYAAIASAKLPVALDALVSSIAEAWQIAEPPHRPEKADDDIERTMIGREQLAQLWTEIRELPLKQRRALLLNLREDDGANALASFVAAKVTTLQELSAVVELDVAALWNSLPLPDREIAESLGLTRQQVINLRMSARRRLRRRLSSTVSQRCT